MQMGLGGQINTFTHARMHTGTHTHMHACTYACTHTHTHVLHHLLELQQSSLGHGAASVQLTASQVHRLHPSKPLCLSRKEEIEGGSSLHAIGHLESTTNRFTGPLENGIIFDAESIIRSP